MAASLIMRIMVDEINRKRPEERQISLSSVTDALPWKLMSLHRRYYPQSRLRLLLGFFDCSIIGFFVLLLWKLGFFR